MRPKIPSNISMLDKTPHVILLHRRESTAVHWEGLRHTVLRLTGSEPADGIDRAPPPPPPPPGSERAGAPRLKAIFAGYCPRCCRGTVFNPGLGGLLGMMNESCAVCGLVYLREAGYFLGAMYISYGLGVLTVLSLALALVVLLDVPLAVVLTIATVQTLVSVPLLVRYSRAIWLHVDQVIAPASRRP